MFYILLNIVLSSFFILCLKWLQGRDEDTVTVGAINYIAAGLVGGASFFATESRSVTFDTALLGSVNGFCYFVAFFLVTSAVSWKGAAMTAVVSRLSILMPVALGVLCWGERPGATQLLGIGLACVSLAIIGQRGTNLATAKTPAYEVATLVSLFALAGGARVAQEMFKYHCQPQEQPGYVFVAFGLAAAASVVLLALRRRRPMAVEILVGSTLGLTNAFQTLFLLKALESLPGFVVFPATSAGGLLFTMTVAVVLLKEQLSRLSYVGVAVGAMSLALLKLDG